jgi:hypothetical protein
MQCRQMDDRGKPSARPQPGPDSRTASLSILTPGQAGVEKERGLIRRNLEGSGCHIPPIRLSWPFRSWAGWRRSRGSTCARIIEAATLETWRQIDAGRRSATADTVADGNRTLLFRRPLGPAFTYLVTLAGTRPCPAPSRSRSVPAAGRGAAAADHDQRADAAGRREHRHLRGRMEAHRRRYAAGLPGIHPRPPQSGTRHLDHPAGAAGDRLPAAGADRPARRWRADPMGRGPARRAARVANAPRPACPAAPAGGRHGDRPGRRAHLPVRWLRRRRAQPGLDGPRPRAVRCHDHAARHSRLSRASGDGGHAQLQPATETQTGSRSSSRPPA